MEKTKNTSQNENLFEDLKAFGEGIAAIPPGTATKPTKDYYVRIKGHGNSFTMELKWGEVNLPIQRGRFVEYFDFVQVYHGQYQFFKKENFTGDSIIVSKDKIWRGSPSFRFKEIKSWRSI